MSEDSGKRGLRAFMDWVENGPDWEDEAGVHEGGAGGHGEADTVHASDQAVKRNTKRTMGRRFAEFTEEHACVCSAVSTGLWRRSSVWQAWQCFS